MAQVAPADPGRVCVSITWFAPWLVLAVYALLIWVMTPRAISAAQFFGGGSRRGVPPGAWLLGVSAAMSWVMAKSVYNAMNLSASFGFIGGLAYGSYWLSFIVVGIAVYFMRTRGGYTSLPQFLRHKYGASAAKMFMVVIAIRLFNEVWSNTKVTSQFFGPEGSAPYWTAAVVMTAFTVYYSLRGGLRSSILTDAMQALVMAVLLVVMLAVLTPEFAEHGFPSVATGGVSPAMHAGGLTFLALALVQCLSYGFHDPVLTDRAFVSRPASMVRAFIVAAILGGVLIALFSLAGVYALAVDVSTDAPIPVAVPAVIGLWMALLFNAVMLTSAGSTLDSTFSSTAKFVSRDWPAEQGECTAPQVRRGRWAMAAIAIIGNLPLLSLYSGNRGDYDQRHCDHGARAYLSVGLAAISRALELLASILAGYGHRGAQGRRSLRRGLGLSVVDRYWCRCLRPGSGYQRLGIGHLYDGLSGWFADRESS